MVAKGTCGQDRARSAHVSLACLAIPAVETGPEFPAHGCPPSPLGSDVKVRAVACWGSAGP